MGPGPWALLVFTERYIKSTSMCQVDVGIGDQREEEAADCGRGSEL